MALIYYAITVKVNGNVMGTDWCVTRELAEEYMFSNLFGMRVKSKDIKEAKLSIFMCGHTLKVIKDKINTGHFRRKYVSFLRKWGWKEEEI